MHEIVPRRTRKKSAEKLINPCFTQERNEKKRKIVENIDCDFMQKRVL